MSSFPSPLSCRQMGFGLLLGMVLFACQSGRAQSAGQPMPDGEIQTIMVGAKRMTVRDILDSVAAHRVPDTNPFMLRTNLSVKLYTKDTTYFSFQREVFLNHRHKIAYTPCTDSLSLLVPHINLLSQEQQRRQQNGGTLILWTYEHLMRDSYLDEILSLGRPFYKVDTGIANPQIHLFFLVTRSKWNTRLFDRKIMKGDTENLKVVRYHKMDIDRVTWTVRHKERGTAKITAARLDAWEAAKTYNAQEVLLQELKADSSMQMDRESVSFPPFAGGALVPVSFNSFDNFSPVAVPMLVGDAVENPEGSSFEIIISNTQITDKPHNPDYHFMRVVGLNAIFKSPFEKGKK